MSELYKTILSVPAKGSPVTFNRRKIGEVTGSEVKDGTTLVSFVVEDEKVKSLIKSSLVDSAFSIDMKPNSYPYTLPLSESDVSDHIKKEASYEFIRKVKQLKDDNTTLVINYDFAQTLVYELCGPPIDRITSEMSTDQVFQFQLGKLRFILGHLLLMNIVFTGHKLENKWIVGK